MVFFSSKALFACVHASALLAGSSFLPVSLAKENMDAAILHHQEESLRARSVGKPHTSAAAAAASFAVSDGNVKAVTSNRSLVDVTFDNHNDGIGQDRFHLVSNFEGGSYPNGESTKLHDLSMGRRVALSKLGSTAAIAGVLYDETSEKFRWIVKIFKKDSGTGDWDTSDPIEILEDVSKASFFEYDAYVEIALSGDGGAIFIANVKAKRFENDTQEQGTITKYSISSSATLVPSWPLSFEVTPDSATAVGYYFTGLQVAADDSDNLVVGIPYNQKVELIDSTGTKIAMTFPSVASSLLGRSVVISKDGTTVAASAPGDHKIYIASRSSSTTTDWVYEQINGPAIVGDDESDFGSSLAINEDGTIIAIGYKKHDAGGDRDKGSVTVMIKKNNVWGKLGQTLTGERGEGVAGINYYVGDQFGTSLAISDKNSYNGTGPSNTIKVVIGAPKNDPDGATSDDYYNGHVEVYEIDPDVTNAQFSQVAYDIDGGSSKEKSGTSVAIDSEGKSILIGSPGFQASSINEYFEGVAKMYEQTEYSAVPSVVPSSVPSVTMNPSSVPSMTVLPSVSPSESVMPSSVPSDSSAPSSSPSVSMNPSLAPSVTVLPSVSPSESVMPSSVPSDSSAPSSSQSVSMNPSSMPSVTSLPSVLPSVSIQPSIAPSLSSFPSLAPSLSASPSFFPSAVLDKEFQILSTFEKFDQTKYWCLTTAAKTYGSKLHVRPCRSYDKRAENLQLWKFTSAGKLTLAGTSNAEEFCVKSSFRLLQLGNCNDANDTSVINFDFNKGSVTQTRGDKVWQVGFDPESRFERVRLYRSGALNDVLDKWDLRYFKLALPGDNTATDLTLSEEPLTSNDCLSVNDIVPTLVDWQGSWIRDKQFADNIILVPSGMSNVNRFLAYMDTENHCKMVLFEIERDSATNICSYVPLLAKDKSGACGDVYCEFLTSGGCQTLVGDEDSSGFGIEELQFEYQTPSTSDRGSLCSAETSINTCGRDDLELFVIEPSALPSLSPSDQPSFVPSSSMVPSQSPTNTPPPIQISMKFFHGCAAYSSKVQCVGYNRYGQVSDSSSDVVTKPVPFTFPEGNSASPIKVVTGVDHTCVLMDDKSVWCKGRNNYVQLGDMTIPISSVTPVQVKNGGTEITNAIDIETGFNHNCIKLSDDSLYCFGWNVANQLGFNGETNVKLMALSYLATCIVKNSKLNEVLCKGNSNFNDKIYPMGDGEEIVKLVSGEGHFCVLLKSMKAKCFGQNNYGQLGDGPRTNSYNSAVDVVDSSSTNGSSPLSDITDINAGLHSTCLVVSNNTPMCFGYNYYSQLGIANGRVVVVVPTELDGVTLQTTRGDIASIHVGYYTGHVVYQDNSVYSWGNNARGGLGDESVTSDTVIGDGVGEDAVEMAFNWN